MARGINKKSARGGGGYTTQLKRGAATPESKHVATTGCRVPWIFVLVFVFCRATLSLVELWHFLL